MNDRGSRHSVEIEEMSLAGSVIREYSWNTVPRGFLTTKYIPPAEIADPLA